MKIAVLAAFLLIAHHAFVSEAQNLTTVCGQQINRYNTGVKTCNVASDCNGYYYVGSCWTWKCDTSKWDPNNQLSYDCGICTQTPQPDGAYCNNYSGSFCTGSGSGTCYSGVCTQSTQYQTGCTSDETCDDRLATCTSKTCETGYGSRIRYSSPWGSSSAYSVVNDLTYSGNRVVAVGSTGANELNYPNTAVLSKGTGMEVLMTLTHPSDLRGLTLKFSWGGNGDDSATAIAVSSDYRAYIVGSTKSSNYPSISAPSFLTSCGAGYSYGIASAFVTALNLNPTLGGNLAPTVIFSGCWGYATLNIEISDIGINTGFYYIVGSTTLGANFPSTNAWTGVTYGAAGNKDGFIRKISRSTNSVAFSSRWGTSTGAEAITSIEVNPNVPTTATGVEFVLSGTTTAPASYYTTTTTSFCTQGTVPSSVTSLGFYITGNAAYSYPTLPGYSSLLCNSNSLVDIPKLVVNWAYSNAFDVVVTFSSSLLRSIYSTGAAPPAAGITQNTVTLIQHIIGSPARPLIRSAVINRNVANVKLALSNGFVHMVGSWDAITAMDNININLKPDSINAPLGAAVYPMDHTDVYYKKLTYASLHSRPVVAAVFGDTDEDIPNAIAAFDNTGNAPEIYASQGTYIAQTLYPSQVAFGGFSLSGGYPKVFTTDSTQTGTGFITMLDPDCIDGKDLNRLKSTAGIPTAKKHLTEPKKKQARDLSRTRVYIIGDGIDNNFGNVPVYTTKQTPYDVAGPERSQTTYLASIIADVSPNVDIVLAQVSSVPTHVTPNAANHKTQLDAALLGIINDMDAIKAYYQYPSAIVYYSSHVASTVPSTWNTANSYATQLINRGAIIIAASGPEGMTNMENPAGISGTTTYWPFVNYGTGDANKYAIFVGAEYYSSNLGTSRLRNTNKGAPVQFFAPGIYPGVISKSSSFYQPGNVNGIARVGQLATTTTHLASETAGAITVGVVSAIIQNKLPEKLTHVEAIKHLQYYSTLRIDTDTGLPVPGQYSVKLPTAATCTDRSDLP